MNCVDWKQASAYCGWKRMRLPSEVEWEYAARGGSKYLSYSFGNDKPDGKTCWKHVGGTCKVRSFPAGAFGLHDMTGNVWEWTSSGFGPYPWPPAHAIARVDNRVLDLLFDHLCEDAALRLEFADERPVL